MIISKRPEKHGLCIIVYYIPLIGVDYQFTDNTIASLTGESLPISPNDHQNIEQNLSEFLRKLTNADGFVLSPDNISEKLTTDLLKRLPESSPSYQQQSLLLSLVLC